MVDKSTGQVFDIIKGFIRDWGEGVITPDEALVKILNEVMAPAKEALHRIEYDAKPPKKSAVKWMGEQKCNLCSSDFADAGPEFYDAPVVGDGRWAIICYHCKDKVGAMGQVYNSGTMEKICDVQDRR